MHTATAAFSHTISLGEAALAFIKRFNVSADPASYEIWYTYAAGHHRLLTQYLDVIVARDGGVSQRDIDDLRRRHLGVTDRGTRINQIGRQLEDEVDQVVGMIEAAIGVAADLDRDLGQTNARLTGSIDRETLRGIVEAVLSASREMQAENARLGKSLNDSRQDILKLQQNLDFITKESLTDALTGLANRRHFDQSLREAIEHAQLANLSLSLLLADVDEFKQFNDTHGHQLGDDVLRLIGNTLRINVKGQDLVARYGGEEFAVILPATELSQATRVAERLRQAVAGNEIRKRSTDENLGRITISVGVAALNVREPQTLIEVADACLYAAKRRGRNRVVSELELEPGKWSVDR